MMKPSSFTQIIAASALAWAFTSCSFLNPGPLPEALVGEQTGELKNKLCELMEMAGTDSTQVEFADISSNFLYRPNDNTSNVSIQIVSAKDKNQLMEYMWSDMKDRRNMKVAQELTVSTFLGNDVIDNYEGYQDMLFRYDDIRIYLDNLPVYCQEALEASGYKDQGYVNSFNIDRQRGATISVGHKKESSLSKTYEISEDGQHIVVHD